MIGIDTNVLMRLIVGDEPKQAVAARNYVRAHCSTDDPGYVSLVVLVELAWTLSKVYGFRRDQIADAIEQLLDTRQFAVEASDVVAEAVRIYRSASHDFADCLIARSNVSAGCQHTITFHRKAASLPNVKLLAV